ncbi:MAG: Chromate resistance protein ChrB [Candidatus Limnocylindrales bacterium]
MKGTPEAQTWLLLVYRIKSGSSSRRTYVWRQLRQLGAIYLQQAVAILPDRPELRAGLDKLGQRIRSGGGEASLLTTSSPDTAWEADVVERFNVARNAEYDEIVESVERFEDEIRRESRKQRFRFAELEESEADWEKLRRWFARLLERDFFGASGRAGADEALTRGHDLLEAFTREVYRLEGLDSDAEGERPRG